MEDKLDNGFIKNHFESPQYGESTFSDSGHVIYQDRILFIRWYVRIVQYAIDCTRCTVRLTHPDKQYYTVSKCKKDG